MIKSARLSATTWKLIGACAALLLGAALSSGCSDDDSSGADAGSTGGGGGGGGVACNASFAPCGGDVEGSWTYQTACSDYDYEADLQTLCPGASISSLTISVNGTLELSGGTVGGGGTWTTNFIGEIPAECVTPFGSCTGLASALEQSDPNVTVSCTGSDACTCNYSETDSPILGDSYTVNGNVVTTSDSDYEFCVDGSTLTYRPVVDSDTPSVTFVLTR